MMTRRQGITMPPRPPLGWPPDDTEESVLGTNLHQATITNLRVGLNEVAAALAPPGQAAPWQALSQTIIRNFRRRDGSRYKTLPDVFVYRQAIDERRKSLSVETDGPPVLIVESLSDSTHDVDLNLMDGKGYSYAHAGVREYLILDPTGEFMPERGQGWRLHDGVYRPWLPNEQGRWQSQEIAAAIGLEGVQVVVYTSDGRRQLREGEVARELARRDAELARRDAEIRRQDAELARRDAELAALRRLLEQRTTGHENPDNPTEA